MWDFVVEWLQHTLLAAVLFIKESSTCVDDTGSSWTHLFFILQFLITSSWYYRRCMQYISGYSKVQDYPYLYEIRAYNHTCCWTVYIPITTQVGIIKLHNIPQFEGLFSNITVDMRCWSFPPLILGQRVILQALLYDTSCSILPL